MHYIWFLSSLVITGVLGHHPIRIQLERLSLPLFHWLGARYLPDIIAALYATLMNHRIV